MHGVSTIRSYVASITLIHFLNLYKHFESQRRQAWRLYITFIRRDHTLNHFLNLYKHFDSQRRHAWRLYITSIRRIYALLIRTNIFDPQRRHAWRLYYITFIHRVHNIKSFSKSIQTFLIRRDAMHGVSTLRSYVAFMNYDHTSRSYVKSFSKSIQTF